ncbi:hypothetical protein Hamer_G012035 [Homarus americanus]|uniref:HTH psq-type domain-containing protein n=1 Tax=Homarus americanus TaxID=6706 RepID=A0A8J5JGQ4_HOMAM|nr:hypothetical protein Hamer_G012035 [Homarus americanus]
MALFGITRPSTHIVIGLAAWSCDVARAVQEERVEWVCSFPPCSPQCADTVYSHEVLQYSIYCTCIAPCIMPPKHPLRSPGTSGVKKRKAITIEITMDVLKRRERGERTADIKCAFELGESTL